MRHLKVLRTVALAAVAFGMSAAADAATVFNFSFSAPWLLSTQTGSGSGQLFADLQTDGTYQVTSVTGTATTNAGAAPTSLTTFSGILLGGTPAIAGNATTGFSLNSIMLGDAVNGYSISRNPLDSNYTISTGLRTTGAGTFSVALASPAAVPEAATWTMMILGFGAIGAALRQGRRSSRALA